MARKIVIGMLAAFIGIGLAAAGYEFGRHLAQSSGKQATHQSDTSA